MNKEYSNPKSERISLSRELGNISGVKNNTIYYTKNKFGSGLTYSTKHHDRAGRAYETKTRGTIKEKLAAMDKAGASNRIFVEKTKDNLYLDRDGKIRTHEKVEKGLYGKMLVEHLDYYKAEWEREKHSGLTLEEIRELYAEAIDKSGLSNTKKRVLHRKLDEAKLETDMFEQIVKKGKVDKIFSTTTHKNLIKWRARARTFEKYIAGEKNRRIFDEIIVALPEDKMIDRGVYTPAYDATKLTNHNDLIFDGTSEHPVKYYGVKNYDRKEMEAIINAQIKGIEKLLNEYLGELPEGMKRVAAAVMHVDEKTPHIHITYSNLEYTDGKFKHASRKVMGASYKERAERVTQLKNVITEKIRELGYELENHITPDRTKLEKVKAPKKKSVGSYHKKLAKASSISRDKLTQVVNEIELTREHTLKLEETKEHLERAKERIFEGIERVLDTDHTEIGLTFEKFEFRMTTFKPVKGEPLSNIYTDFRLAGIPASQHDQKLYDMYETYKDEFVERYERETEKTREYDFEITKEPW